MTLRKTIAGTAVLLHPSGRLDHETAAGFGDAFLAEVRGGGVVVLDLGEVSYVSSVGLRAIMMGAKESKAAGGSLAVVNLQPTVGEIFQISRFHFVVAMFDTARDALAKFAPDAVAHLDPG